MNFLQSLTDFCCTPTKTNRREEERYMKESIKSDYLNTSVRLNKKGVRKIDIKDLKTD